MVSPAAAVAVAACCCHMPECNPAGFSQPRVRHFPAQQLPSAPAARFAALFAAQPRWTREQLDPYLEGLKVGLGGMPCIMQFVPAGQGSNALRAIT